MGYFLYVLIAGDGFDIILAAGAAFAVVAGIDIMRDIFKLARKALPASDTVAER